MPGKLQGRAISNTANVILQSITVGNSTSNATVNSTAVVIGNVTITASQIAVGNSTVNAVINSSAVTAAGGATFGGHLMPSANITYDIGNSSMRWRDLWLSGTTINLGGATIKTDTDTGAVAIIPKPTTDTPDPLAVVISPAGGVTAVPTTGGMVLVGMAIILVVVAIKMHLIG
jgi:hypothetical protein